MYIDQIYVQDNFVPNPQLDQFRRRVIGASVRIKEGESREEAEAFGEQYIKEYIKRNSVVYGNVIKGIDYTEHTPEMTVGKSGLREGISADEPPPKVTIEEPYNLINEINSCRSPTVLKIYEKQCKTNEEKAAYSGKLKQLEVHPFNR